MSEKIAVIDIGSNTIKLLVAEEDPQGTVATVDRKTLETRLGQGISSADPRFSPELINRATEAIVSLVAEARAFSPADIRIVATSAVRDALNRDELTAAVAEQTDLALEILSGRREAELIGTAIQLDPNISASDFYVFDLGGGSLECLAFAGRQLAQVVSLPLGCVRLAEKLIAEPNAIFTEEDEHAVATEIDAVFDESHFTFSLPPQAIAVGTGGTLTTALNILAGQRGHALEEGPLCLSRADLRALLNHIGSRVFSDRLQVKGLSAGRADVFPTALATFLKLAELTGQDGFHHSFFNLRYGLAAEMLGLAKKPEQTRSPAGPPSSAGR